MSLLARNTVRAVARTNRQARFNSNNAAAKEWAEERAHLKAHAAETTELWRRISYFVCVPAIAVCIAWVRNAEAEHMEHMEHLKHENDGKIPQPPDYDYLNKRAKPFPWGMNSLFFNSEVNKDMSVESE